ncbi:sialidase family protein [Actinoplanes sp. NPDC026619]|uniref:sialidase family protein n=1 Tax=Actinoplanes sp. NPDC026619 TaxID=3155798 RepID=UPI0033F9950A
MSEPIIVAQAADGLQAHFPDVVRLAGGRLVAAYREGAGHISHEGRIVVVASDDDGQSWSAPEIVVDGPHDDRDPKLAVLADGTILLSYFVLEWTSEKEHKNHGVLVRRSTDAGRTWSEPAQVGSIWWASHGAAVELPGGDLLLPVYNRPPGERWHRAAVVRSTDGGRTWPAASEVSLAAGSTFHFQEPTLTVLDGQLVSLIRTTVETAYLSRSTDDGRTWTAPVPTDMPASSHHALRLASGEVLVTYGDLSKRFSEHRETVGRLVRRPLETWDGYPDIQLYDSGHHDQANPSSVELSPGRFLTLGFDIPARTVVAFISSATDYYS